MSLTRPHDPFAPPDPRPDPGPVLPTGRLARLGATARTGAAIAAAWATLTATSRERWVENWAYLTDGELDADLAGIDHLHGATVAALVDWVTASDLPLASATALATAIDHGEHPSLAGRLERMSR